jgi:hypothetical protein
MAPPLGGRANVRQDYLLEVGIHDTLGDEAKRRQPQALTVDLGHRSTQLSFNPP